MARRYQFVWWWRWLSLTVPLRLPTAYPDDGPNEGKIYRWVMRIGPLEIRRWA